VELASSWLASNITSPDCEAVDANGVDDDPLGPAPPDSDGPEPLVRPVDDAGLLASRWSKALSASALQPMTQCKRRTVIRYVLGG
jgi:hypothetical protein